MILKHDNHEAIGETVRDSVMRSKCGLRGALAEASDKHVTHQI